MERHALVDAAVRLEKLIPRLASDHAGEVVVTAEAIRRTLAAVGMDLHDLARAIADHLAPAQRRSAKHGPKRAAVPDSVFHELRVVIDSAFASQREFDIASSLLYQAHRFGGLTARQLDLAADINQRVRLAGGDE